MQTRLRHDNTVLAVSLEKSGYSLSFYCEFKGKIRFRAQRTRWRGLSFHCHKLLAQLASQTALACSTNSFHEMFNIYRDLSGHMQEKSATRTGKTPTKVWYQLAYCGEIILLVFLAGISLIEMIFPFSSAAFFFFFFSERPFWPKTISPPVATDANRLADSVSFLPIEVSCVVRRRILSNRRRLGGAIAGFLPLQKFGSVYSAPGVARSENSRIQWLAMKL